MTKLTGLIGFPVSHSLSPAIQSYWIEKHGLDADYKLLTTPPKRLRQTMLHMRQKNAVGVNVTIPHKQAVIEYLDGLDASATRIGAVNTVVSRTGKFIGHNTDAYGFITNLNESLGDLKSHLENIVLLGAGGATRAAIVALADAGAKNITLTNRTIDKAIALANEFEIEAAPWEDRAALLNGATLLVNTTSLGMDGQPPLEIDLKFLPDGAAVHDIVYAPLETALLKTARLRGHTVVDGLGMLLYQAQAAFELWHGMRPDVTPELRAHVLKIHKDQAV
jgi:shikimate dehydrogenase